MYINSNQVQHIGLTIIYGSVSLFIREELMNNYPNDNNLTLKWINNDNNLSKRTKKG